MVVNDKEMKMLVNLFLEAVRLNHTEIALDNTGYHFDSPESCSLKDKGMIEIFNRTIVRITSSGIREIEEALKIIASKANSEDIRKIETTSQIEGAVKGIVDTDKFEEAIRSIEHLAKLKEKNLIEDGDYDELKSLFILYLKRSALFRQESIFEDSQRTSQIQNPTTSYGHLHSLIVDKILSCCESAEGDPRQRVLKAIDVMMDKKALYSNDLKVLQELVDTVFTPLKGSLDDTNGKASLQLLKIERSLIEIAAKIRDVKEVSPTAKAIADTTLQSTARATGEFNAEHKKPEAKQTPLSKFWGRFVLPDVKGAFEGGAAAATIAGGFAPAFGAILPIPIAATFGVVVGAGIQSADAYVKRGTKS